MLPVFSVIDIETSGLSTRRHRILQIAVARVEGGEIVDEWSSLVKLRWPWQRVGPRRVHGISRRTLRGAPRPDDALTELRDIVRDKDWDRIQEVLDVDNHILFTIIQRFSFIQRIQKRLHLITRLHQLRHIPH